MSSRSATLDQPVNKAASEGFITRKIRFVTNVIGWIIIALLFSILIEWAGIFMRWWDQPGAEHAVHVLSRELSWINRDFASVLGSPAETSIRFSRFMYELLFVWFHIDLAQSLLTVDSLASVAAYIKAALTIIQLFFVRVVILLFAMPVFIVFGIVAFVDGLAMRDLRRFGLDLEHSKLWHTAERSIKPLVITPFVLYLGSPWSIHPNWIVLPFAVSLSIALWMVAYLYKKSL